MFKFIIFCAVASLCVARNLNDDNTQPAVITIADLVAEARTPDAAEPKDIAVEDIVDESDSAAAIDSNSDDIIDSANTRRLLFKFSTAAATSTTTPLPMMQAIELLLTLNSVASAG